MTAHPIRDWGYYFLSKGACALAKIEKYQEEESTAELK